jgi:MFS superfamily sulfate permease-like transporter
MLGLSRLLNTAVYMSPFHKFLFLCRHIHDLNPYTAIMSLVSLSCLIGARLAKQHTRGRAGKVLRYLPEIFIIVVISTGEWNSDGLADRVADCFPTQSSLPYASSISRASTCWERSRRTEDRLLACHSLPGT